MNIIFVHLALELSTFQSQPKLFLESKTFYPINCESIAVQVLHFVGREVSQKFKDHIIDGVRGLETVKNV